MLSLPAMFSQFARGPFVTVSPAGVSNGLSTLPNNRADYGPDTPGTVTMGLQEAMNDLAASGALFGTVYVRKGTYTLDAAMGQTGNYQRVVFEPGTGLVLGSSFSGVDLGQGIPLLSIGWPAGTTPPSTAFHHCYWFGNGTTINLNQEASTMAIGLAAFGPLNTGPSPPFQIWVDGFEITNPSYDAIEVDTNNGNGSHPNYNQQLREVLISRMYVHGVPSDYTAQCVKIDGVRQIEVADCYFDESLTSSPSNSVFCLAQNGDTTGITFRRCTVIANGTPGVTEIQVVELQGSSDATGGTNLSRVFFDDCDFVAAGSTGPVLAGAGGGYIDDNNNATQSTNSWVTNVEFRRCRFGNVGFSFQSAATGKFGYIRFTDGSSPAAISGALTGRGPNSSGAAISVGGSPFTYQNLDGFDEVVTVQGGTVSAISQNGDTTALIHGAFLLRNGDTLKVTYTSAPAMNKVGE